ncbi:phosphotransferase enzyme family protein [Nemania sp. FL0031]|nr:phosphotransferase enzyme family protein [Nemania sp. FL0031]
MTPKTSLDAQVIEKVDQVTVEFVAEALSVSGIVSFVATKIGTGQVGEVYRLSLSYEDIAPPEQPATVILKIPSSNPRSRATAVSINLYENEARFYAEILPLLPKTARAAVPRCFHVGFNPETAVASLLLEDAGTDALVEDDISRATLEQALLAMRTLALMHGVLRPVLTDEEKASWLKKASWLIRGPNADEGFFREIFLNFKVQFEKRMAPEHLEICEKWVPAFGWWIQQQLTASPEKTGVKHSDYRLDNLLFTADRGMKVVDWQFIMTGPLVSDIAHFLACSLKIEDRRAWQDDLLRAYCDALAQVLPAEFGPALTFEEASQELRLQTLGILTTHIMSSQLIDSTDRGDDMFMALIARECELVRDTNALELLPVLPPQSLTPLRPRIENEYLHPAAMGKYWSESWYFDFADEAQGIAGWIRFAIRPRLKGNWYTATIIQKGKGVYQIADYVAPGVVVDGHSLRLAKPGAYDVVQEVNTGEELQTYRIKMLSDAVARYHDASDILLDVSPLSTNDGMSFNLSFDTAGIIYSYRILTRYEVPCTVTGSLVINGTSIQLNSAYAQRGHSWGPRDWCGSDWIWSAFCLPAKGGSTTETRVHASQLRWPGRPSMSMGYVQTGNDIREIEGLECEEGVVTKHALVNASNMQMVTGMRMKILAHGKEEMVVQIGPQDHAPLKLVSDDGRASMFDRAWGKVKASDGREGVGWFEWNMNVWE